VLNCGDVARAPAARTSRAAVGPHSHHIQEVSASGRPLWVRAASSPHPPRFECDPLTRPEGPFPQESSSRTRLTKRLGSSVLFKSPVRGYQERDHPRKYEPDGVTEIGIIAALVWAMA
jgi:hypothetical protein